MSKRRDLASELQHQMAQVRMSASELEALTGIKRATIYYILNGKTKRPKVESLAKIAQALATDPIDKSAVDGANLGRIYRALVEASGQFLGGMFKLTDVVGIDGKVRRGMTHLPVISVPGIGYVPDADAEYQNRRTLSLRRELSDVADGLKAAVDNGLVDDREVRMAIGVLRSILDAVDPEYEFHGRATPLLPAEEDIDRTFVEETSE